jgi:Putative Flp pilus-assembly TadE/G-like
MRYLHRPSISTIRSFWNDERGIILPYVAITIAAMVGVGALALDGARLASLQTQTQAAADALAIAGARELNQQSGAQARARAAIGALVSNSLTGMGTATIGAPTITFYSGLNAANSGFGGTAPTDDVDTRFVGISLSTTALPRILPVSTATYHGVAQSMAGFTSQPVCNAIVPLFICNPYETAGQTDAAATRALKTSLANAATLRKQLRLSLASTGPGQYGFLAPPSNCSGANCLRNEIMKTNTTTCYSDAGVTINSNFRNPASDGINVRFDIYSSPLTYASTNAPALNVRKGYFPKNTNKGDWCNAIVNADNQHPYYTTKPTFTKPIVATQGKVNKNSGSITSVLAADATSVAQLTSIGKPMVKDPPNNALASNAILSGASGTTLTLDQSNMANSNQNNDPMTVQWPTSALPRDASLVADNTLFMGDGNWDCTSYWKINHGTLAAPTGCTDSPPTISRYKVYRYEIENCSGCYADWSGNGLQSLKAPNNNGNGESGAPYCAIQSGGAGVDPSLNSAQPDRRILYAPIINCLAQATAVSNHNAPVASFGKFFITQPMQADGTDNLYGEMVGLACGGGDPAVTCYHQVQLFR